MATSITPEASNGENAIVGTIGTLVFIGTLVYGVKQNHPWIGFVAGLGFAGIVTQLMYAALNVTPYSPDRQIVVTQQGARAV